MLGGWHKTFSNSLKCGCDSGSVNEIPKVLVFNYGVLIKP